MPRKITTPRDPRQVDATTYNRVVARTQVLSIRLLESKFEIKPEAIGVEPSEWRKQVNFELGEVVVTENGRLYGVVKFEVVCRHGRKRVLHAATRYLASYQVDGPCSQEDGETVLFFTNDGWREPTRFTGHCSTKWATFFVGLKALLEGGSSNVYPDEIVISSWDR